MDAVVPSRHRGRRRLVGTVVLTSLVGSMVVLAVLAGAVPARLSAAAPADGATLGTPPTSVTLTFSAPVDPGRSHLSIAHGSGAPVDQGPTRYADRTVSRPVAIERAGDYLIAFHIVLLGGAREVSGVLRFAVASDPAAAGTPTTDPATASATAATGSAPRAGGHSHGGADPVTLAVLALDAGVVVVALVVLAYRRRRRGPSAGRSRPSER